MSTWKLTKKLKETHLSSAFSPRSSSDQSNGKSHSPVSKSSSSQSLDKLPATSSKPPLSLPSVTAGNHSPGRKVKSDTDGPVPASPPSLALSSAVSSTSSLKDISTTPAIYSSGTLAPAPIPSNASSASSTSLAGPSSSNDNWMASSTSTITPGLLVVSISNATGLSLMPGHSWPSHVLNSLAGPGSVGQSAAGTSLLKGSSISPRKQQVANPSQLQIQRDKASNAGMPRRRPPIYLVVEYDKTQVILDATSGTVDGPVWDKAPNFDVSRAESLTIQVFAKIPIQASHEGGHASSSFTPPTSTFGVRSPVVSGDSVSSNEQNSVGTGTVSSDAVRRKGYEEVFLGTCKIDIDLSKTVIFDGWLPLSSGTGKIQLKIEFKPNKNKHLTIEDFDLLKVVGKGSFGKVMQVRKIDTKQIYALKTIRKAHIISRSEVNHTLAERTVLAQINNPFIVPLKFSFQSPEKLYLVLAFINGGELFHHLQREGRFDLNRSRFYTAELLCALECLHEYNVIYRDLKPENILLDYTGHIALCDFGLCKLNMTGQEKTNTFCGTPEYLAPELLLGQGYTKVVDWWTLGVLFYEMLTGLPPFYDQDTNEMYRKILQEPLRFPDDMDREARSLLVVLLNRDPKKRLGVNGAAEIKSHPFFAQIDWKRLMNKKYAAPYKPSVESASDTSNFDQEFTSEEPTDSVVEKDFYLSDSVQKQFGGWTYTNTDSRMATSGKW